MRLLVFLIIAFSFYLNSCAGQVVPADNTTQNNDSLKKEFAKHFKELDKEAKKNSVNDTTIIYCCRFSINFMAAQTNIEPGTEGNRLGYIGFTKQALKQWHDWYNKKYKK